VENGSVGKSCEFLKQSLLLRAQSVRQRIIHDITRLNERIRLYFNDVYINVIVNVSDVKCNNN